MGLHVFYIGLACCYGQLCNLKNEAENEKMEWVSQQERLQKSHETCNHPDLKPPHDFTDKQTHCSKDELSQFAMKYKVDFLFFFLKKRGENSLTT